MSHAETDQLIIFGCIQLSKEKKLCWKEESPQFLTDTSKIWQKFAYQFISLMKSVLTVKCDNDKYFPSARHLNSRETQVFYEGS